MTTIYVNGRFLSQPVTGVQRFARELLVRLATIRPVAVLVPAKSTPIDIPDGLDVRAFGRLDGHLWEQLELPAFLMRLGSPFLLGLTNTGPVRYRNQVATHHDVTYRRYPRTYSWKFRTAYSLLARELLPRVRRVITVSEFSKSELTDFYGVASNRIDVIPNAVSGEFTRLATPLPDSQREGFLVVGSLLPHKNLDNVVRSFERFRTQTGSSTPLRVIGGISAALPGGLQLSEVEGVELLGRVDDPALATLYASSRALIFASAYEGFGIPPLEAQSYGTPVISSDAAALAETLRDSAYRVRHDSLDEIVAALAAVDSDEDLRSSLSKQGFENAARFSWDASTELLERTIRRALAQD